jgi:hypothetical protein
MLRCEPAVFGPVATDPTVSRLIDTLADSGARALQAMRSARAEVRTPRRSAITSNCLDSPVKLRLILHG